MATRSDIRSYARIRADQTDSTFPTDTEYNTLLDFAGRAVWYDLVQAGWPPRLETATFTADGSTSYNPIPSGATTPVAFVHGVYRQDGATYTPLKRMNEGYRADMLSAAGNQGRFYDIRNDNSDDGLILYLFPVSAAGSYRVDYIKEWTGFANDAEKFPGPARSDELVGLRAAAMGMRKEGNDQGAAQVMQEYAELLQSIQNMAGWFDMRNPPVIQDVDGGLCPPKDPFDFEV